MKMPRSHCENENVQFVQELAEVDGPFESPININFRDLTKVELPSLVWNKNETSPKKMKITNTGHTVIVSGKWKCERPYITGGPLVGKYVFSQIHFHWGEDDCKGSEHQVCGEGFPLEMHVTHFKTEYSTQECALREKDGMVVLVYLFKLQEEPNIGLKKILCALPSVKQAGSSYAMDPRPILSLCNPFTDDYFMYWGSVITSTCAHILLWIVSREPCGISRDQVNEFRKILDSSQQPICRNSREPQPLHKRNVFHVNASKNLDDPLLPIKKMLGCYCKGSEDNVSVNPTSTDCNCRAYTQNQEDVEGSTARFGAGMQCLDVGGTAAYNMNANLSKNTLRQPLIVQRATVQSAPQLPKRLKTRNRLQCFPKNSVKQVKSESKSKSKAKLISQSCCFLPVVERSKSKVRPEWRKPRKKPFASVGALSHIMDSLEALKNHTFKKLKEIDSINQEIKRMKPLCQDTEDKRWIQKIEKMMSRQKRVTVKTSQGCFKELKKLAKECNFDKFFDSKVVPPVDNHKLMLITNKEFTEQILPSPDLCGNEMQKNLDLEKTHSKGLKIDQTAKFSAKAHTIIQSFFEDIKENDELQQVVQKGLELKRTGSLCVKSKLVGDSSSTVSLSKGLITQKMFTLENLGDRLFMEVTAEDLESKKSEGEDKKKAIEFPLSLQDISRKEPLDNLEGNCKIANKNEVQNSLPKSVSNCDEIIPLRRTNIAMGFVETNKNVKESIRSLLKSQNTSLSIEEREVPFLDLLSDAESMTYRGKFLNSFTNIKSERDNSLKNSSVISTRRQMNEQINERLMKSVNPEVLTNFQYSSSSLSTDSADTQRIITENIQKGRSKKEISEHRPIVTKISSRRLFDRVNYKRSKFRNINVEGYYGKKKKLKNKRKKSIALDEKEIKTPFDSYDVSSTSKEDIKMSKLTRKSLKFKLEIEKGSCSTTESGIDYSPLSSTRKPFNADYKQLKSSLRVEELDEGDEISFSDSETRTLVTPKSIDIANHGTIVIAHPFARKTGLGEEEYDWVISKKIVSSIEKQQKTMKRIHMPRSSPHESIPPSRASTNRTGRTFRASSAESRTSQFEKPIADKPEETGLLEQPRNEFVRTEMLSPQILIRNRSLTSLSPRDTRDYSTEKTQRILIENIEEKRESPKETSHPKRKLESLRTEEALNVTPVKNDNRETISDRNKNLVEAQGKDTSVPLEIKDRDGAMVQKPQEYNVGFFTTSKQIHDEELLNKTQLQEGKGKLPMVKRCEIEKYHFLDKELQESKATPQDFSVAEEVPRSEILEQTDSNKAFTNDALNVKEDANLQNSDNKELQTSVSYAAIKKNTKSRPHSAESLNSLTKVYKRKSKKRPHCCKRNSRHYIRKNSSIFRKPNKTESKPLHFLGLTEEEQLKIISVNVAKYLKQKLVEHKRDFDPEKNCSFKEIEQVVLENLQASDERSREMQGEVETKSEDKVSDAKAVEKTDTDRTHSIKSLKSKETKEITFPDEPTKQKKISSPRPAHNFIKLNKLMAGKYKRMSQSSEKKVEQTKEIDELPKSKTFKKKKEISAIPKRNTHLKTEPKFSSLPPASKPPSKTIKVKSEKPKAIPTRTIIPKKIDSKIEKIPESVPPTEETNKEEQEVESETDQKTSPSTSMALQKVTQSKRCIPTYMLTSYLPAPFEIVENQQLKMNNYLVNMKKANVRGYLPKVCYDTNAREKKRSKVDPLFTKDLEYLIKLQMCLNNEISANIENSMNYVKTLLSQDYNGTAIVEKAPINDQLDFYDPCNKGVVLIEMKDYLDYSSSSSDYAEDPGKQCFRRDSADSKNNCQPESKFSSIALLKESGDSGIMNPLLIRDFEGQEDSDSSYNCEISITLNAGANDGERETQVFDPAAYSGEFCTKSLYDLCMSQSNVSQTTTQIGGGSSSNSLCLRPHRKKRKENEISFEMKEKLLEILEAEIKREMAVRYAASTDNSSDALPVKWEDSDIFNRSQSTESSCDNLEVLTQISETMRQYLTDYKERLVQKDEKQVDKERKSEDTS